MKIKVTNFSLESNTILNEITIIFNIFTHMKKTYLIRFIAANCKNIFCSHVFKLLKNYVIDFQLN